MTKLPRKHKVPIYPHSAHPSHPDYPNLPSYMLSSASLHLASQPPTDLVNSLANTTATTDGPSQSNQDGEILSLEYLGPTPVTPRDYPFARFPTNAVATARWMLSPNSLKQGPNQGSCDIGGIGLREAQFTNNPPPPWTPFLSHLHSSTGTTDTMWPQLLPTISDSSTSMLSGTSVRQQQQNALTKILQPPTKRPNRICRKPVKLDPDSDSRTSTSGRPKRHLCEHCPKRFDRTSDLVKHRRVHTGEKPFVCHHCGRAFADSSSLSAHRRIHTGERPYTCNLCGKGFAVSSSLVKHRRIHTGEKPYQCNVCGRTFSDSSSFGAHKKRSRMCSPELISVATQSELPEIECASSISSRLSVS